MNKNQSYIIIKKSLYSSTLILLIFNIIMFLFLIHIEYLIWIIKVISDFYFLNFIIVLKIKFIMYFKFTILINYITLLK